MKIIKLKKFYKYSLILNICILLVSYSRYSYSQEKRAINLQAAWAGTQLASTEGSHSTSDFYKVEYRIMNNRGEGYKANQPTALKNSESKLVVYTKDVGFVKNPLIPDIKITGYRDSNGKLYGVDAYNNDSGRNLDSGPLKFTIKEDRLGNNGNFNDYFANDFIFQTSDNAPEGIYKVYFKIYIYREIYGQVLLDYLYKTGSFPIIVKTTANKNHPQINPRIDYDVPIRCTYGEQISFSVNIYNSGDEEAINSGLQIYLINANFVSVNKKDFDSFGYYDYNDPENRDINVDGIPDSRSRILELYKYDTNIGVNEVIEALVTIKATGDIGSKISIKAAAWGSDPDEFLFNTYNNSKENLVIRRTVKISDNDVINMQYDWPFNGEIERTSHFDNLIQSLPPVKDIIVEYPSTMNISISINDNYVKGEPMTPVVNLWDTYDNPLDYATVNYQIKDKYNVTIMSGTCSGKGNGEYKDTFSIYEVETYTFNVTAFKEGYQIATGTKIFNTIEPTVPILEVSSSLIDFGNINPGEINSVTFWIKNKGIESLEWSITSDVNWITVNPDKGNTTIETDMVEVTVNTTGLTVGSKYSGNLTISSNGGTSTIDVVVNIPSPGPGYVLIASPSMVFEVDYNKNVVWNYGDRTISSTIGQATSAVRLPNGNTLITDSDRYCVIEVSPQGEEIWRWNGSPYRAERLLNGNTLITDVGSKRVIEVDKYKNIVWQLEGIGSWDTSILWTPRSAQRLENGNCLIADTGLMVGVIEVDWEGNIVWQYGRSETEPNKRFIYPWDARRLKDGNTLITDCWLNPRVIIVNSTGNIIWEYNQFTQARSAKELDNGDILISDTFGNQVIRVNRSNKQETWKYSQENFDVEALGEMVPNDANTSEFIELDGNILTVKGIPESIFEVSQGDTTVSVEKLLFSVNSGSALIKKIVIQQFGTATDNDIKSIKVFEDSDENGKLNAISDKLLASGNFSYNTVIFDSLNIKVETNSLKSIFVALDIEEDAKAGNTIGIRLTDKNYISLISPDTVSSINFPIESNEISIKSPPSPLQTSTSTNKFEYSESETINLITIVKDINEISVLGSTVKYVIKSDTSIIFSGVSIDPDNDGIYTAIFQAPVIPGDYLIQITTSKLGYIDQIENLSFKVKDTTPPIGNITINNGASTTKTLLVTLTLSAVDIGSGIGLGSKMKFSNDSISWSEPEDFKDIKANWDLSKYGGNALQGKKAVYVKYSDVAGNWSTAYSNSIEYIKNISITVATNINEGTTIIVDDLTRISPYNGIWVSGTSHTISVDSIQIADSSKRYIFSSWSDGGGRTHTVTPTSDITYTTNLITQYYLSINTNPPEIANIPGSGWYKSDSLIYISAPDTVIFNDIIYTFDVWLINGTQISDNKISVTMDTAHILTANYNALMPYFSFDPAPSPVSDTVCTGDSTSFKIYLKSINNFKSPVNLSIDNISPFPNTGKIRTNFNPNPVIPTDTSILYISATHDLLPGNYSLTIKGSGGEITDSTMIHLTVKELTLIADFAAEPICGYVPLKVQFSDSSINNPSEWMWDFGDGSTSNEKNPLHIYQNAGNYSVKLRVSNMSGSDSLIRENYIKVCSRIFNPADTTDNNSTILLPITAAILIKGDSITFCDQIGVFTEEYSLCVGTGIWEEKNIAITVYGDDALTSEKDGMLVGETYKYKLYDFEAGEIYLVSNIKYKSGDPYYTVNGISIIDTLIFNDNEISIPLSERWNKISSNIIPENAAPENLMTGVRNNMILMKNGKGQIYWPEYEINQIGDWDIRDGYQICMVKEDTLIIKGTNADPTLYPIYLEKGWNLVSYLPKSPMEPRLALESISDNLVIVKDGGSVYWPEYLINQLGMMCPGEGYWINVKENATLTYPAAVPKVITKLSYSTTSVEGNEGVYYESVSNTGNNATILVPAIINPNILGTPLENADEIGIFTENGLCAGVGIWNGKNIAITVWGDDDLTEIIDGFRIGEEYSFRIWDKSEEKEYYASATFSSGSLKYSLNGICILSSLIATKKIGEIGIPVINSLIEDTSIVSIKLSDNTKFVISFEEGRVKGKTLMIVPLGNDISEYKPNVTGFQSTVSYMDISSDIQDTVKVKISFQYIDSMLSMLGIDENDLIIAYYDSLNSKWDSMSTTLDTILNIASVNTNHLSLWALTDKNDPLITKIKSYEPENVPEDYKLYQNYPNPFNLETMIHFDIPKVEKVVFKIYNILGQEIRILVNKTLNAGSYEFFWDGRDDSGKQVSSGIYVYRIQAGNFVKARKMILLK